MHFSLHISQPIWQVKQKWLEQFMQVKAAFKQHIERAKTIQAQKCRRTTGLW